MYVDIFCVNLTCGMRFFIFNPLKNQNQRYEARMGFTGYECLNGIPRPLSGGLAVLFIGKLW